MWQKWEDAKPEPGQKIIVPFEDGSGAVMGLVVDHDGKGTIDFLYAEDGMSLLYYLGSERPQDFDKRIWAALPEDFPLKFMKMHDVH